MQSTERAVADQPLSVQKNAEALFQKGCAWLEKGDTAAARECFDAVIDNLDDGNEPDVLNDYIDKISALELEYLKSHSGEALLTQNAFLDELVDTPLFPPSAQDVLDIQRKVAEANKPVYSVPVVVNQQVVAFIRNFQSQRHERIQECLKRSQEYIEPFKEIMKKYEIPEDLAYLPLIESGYRVNATSRARAKGMWQFMAATARMYGLKVDSVVDERLDPFKAADAAARFLRDHYNTYHDWYLALACYDGGPRRMVRAMNNLQSKDFFRINQSKIMRRETRNYVPAFLAAVIIGHSPEEYGFKMEPPEAIFAGSKTIVIPTPAKLAQVASALNVTLGQLQQLNPELVHDYTPNGKPEYLLRVPAMTDETLVASIEQIKLPKIPAANLYKVRNGDSLFFIARKFRTTVEKIKSANGLKSNMIRPGRSLIIPGGF